VVFYELRKKKLTPWHRTRDSDFVKTRSIALRTHGPAFQSCDLGNARFTKRIYSLGDGIDPKPLIRSPPVSALVLAVPLLICSHEYRRQFHKTQTGDQRYRHGDGADFEEFPGIDYNLFTPKSNEPENRPERTRHREIGTQIDSHQDRVRHNAGFLYVPDRGTAHQTDGQIIHSIREKRVPRELLFLWQPREYSAQVPQSRQS
jgi:hypothetical protein